MCAHRQNKREKVRRGKGRYSRGRYLEDFINLQLNLYSAYREGKMWKSLKLRQRQRSREKESAKGAKK